MVQSITLVRATYQHTFGTVTATFIMKLFIISALIAVSAAARLEHLEAAARGKNLNGATSNQYLPPFGPNGAGSAGGSPPGQNGFGANRASWGATGDLSASNGAPSRYSDATSNKYLPPFGGESNSLNGNSANGAFDAATSNKYLPPNRGSTFGAAGSRSSPNSQYQQQSAFGGQPGFGGHNGQFSSQGPYGQLNNQRPQGQFGSQGPQGQFGSQGDGQYGQNLFSQTGQLGQAGQYGQYGQGFSGVGQRAQQNQYRPGSQQIPQQDFDEETGYHY